MPDASRDPAFLRWAGRGFRLAYSARDAGAILYYAQAMDVRPLLPSIRVPTLVLHREAYPPVPLEFGAYIAEHIVGAQFAALPGRDGMLFCAPTAEGLRHIDEFLTGLHGTAVPDRALASVLFTDVVGSTTHVATLGDSAWRNLLDGHDVVARSVVEQHGGRLVKTTGDGILATFDGPGRAIRCAFALRDALSPIGLEIRAGLHTGEVELRRGDIAGIAVHIAARVLDAAGPGELFVSAAVPMLVAGSGFEFDDRGDHDLRGVPGTWHLFAVKS
jgi:class 3 adenylate cyclase